MSRSNAIGKLREIVDAEEGDVKQSLWKALGDLSGTTIAACKVWVALHPGAKYHPGTHLLRTDRDLQEQQYQGTVGMVIKLGAGAFVDAPGASFHGFGPQIGDWVVARPNQGTQMYINQVPVRSFEDVGIMATTDKPEMFW